MDALKILRKEMELYRAERDQFKLMAETLQIRYSAMKKGLDGRSLEKGSFLDMSSTTKLMNEMREKNLSLTSELEKMRGLLLDKEGDIRVLREEKQNTASKVLLKRDSVESENSVNFPVEEKNSLISKMEVLKKKNAQLQFDFRCLLDEKQELITERDAYKCKSHRLNHELNVVMKGGSTQKQILDVDALVLENKFLQERIKSMDTELDLGRQRVNKYKVNMNLPVSNIF